MKNMHWDVLWIVLGAALVVAFTAFITWVFIHASAMEC